MAHVIDAHAHEPGGITRPPSPPGGRGNTSRRRWWAAAVGLLLAGISLSLGAGQVRASTSVTFSVFNLATQSAGPNAITAGPDGNLWATEFFVGNIVKMSPSGTVLAEYHVPNTVCLVNIINGPDSALWFVDLCGNFIGRITTNGFISEYPVPKDRVLQPWKKQGLGQAPASITIGPDGNLWVAEFGTDRIVQLHPDGTYGSDFMLPRHKHLPAGDPDVSGPDYITTGADGNLWFTESRFGGGPLVGNRVTRMTVNGVFTEFPIPTADSRPHRIVSGPDNALWFTEENANQIGRTDVNGNMTEYAVPTASSIPDGITVGPDGALWFTEASGSAPGLGRVDTSGNVSEFTSPSAPTDPQSIGAVGICLGPDNNIWFTEIAPNTVVKAVVTSS